MFHCTIGFIHQIVSSRKDRVFLYTPPLKSVQNSNTILRAILVVDTTLYGYIWVYRGMGMQKQTSEKLELWKHRKLVKWKIGKMLKYKSGQVGQTNGWTDKHLSVPLIYFLTSPNSHFSNFTLFHFSTFYFFNFPPLDLCIPLHNITYPYIPIHSNIYHSYSRLDSIGILHNFKGGGVL